MCALRGDEKEPLLVMAATALGETGQTNAARTVLDAFLDQQGGNDSAYALSASGWTTSAELAMRLGSGLQAGVVTINDVLYAYDEPAAAWSGFRRSGLGTVHGRAGLEEMSRRRFVSFDRERDFFHGSV